MMKKSPSLYWKLFSSTFSLSAFTFGGGFVIVPLMRERFVHQYRWLEEEEMLDLIAISQSSPGPIAVNASILVGYRIAGVPGALISVLGTVLPPLIILSVISFFYDAFRSNVYVSLVMKGMQAGVAAVIADVVISMGKGIVSLRRALPILVMLGTFLAVSLLHCNVIVIILICGVIGAIDSWFRHKAESERGAR